MDLKKDVSNYGVLVVNLGTPAAPTAAAIKPYLKQFLSDRRVVDAPRWLWWLILNGIILPIRSRKVAHNYQSVWLPEGSPLLVHSQRQAAALSRELAEQRLPVAVELAMTYGEPLLDKAIDRLLAQGVERIVVLPMYPQYSCSTTASVFDAVARSCQRLRRIPELRMIHDYHQHPLYIDALAQQVTAFRNEHGDSELLLMSFHGIPQRYAQTGDPYPQQCEATAQALATKLQLADSQWRQTYQSRFGREPWLQPYTDETLKALPNEDVQSVQVICPGFTADCLETLEEIAMENKEVFLAAGGTSYAYIPALNDEASQTELFTALVKEQLQGW